MKKSNVLLNIALGIIVCIIVIPCIFLFGSRWSNSGKEHGEVYYLIPANNSLKAIDVRVTETDTLAAAQELLTQMKTPPNKDGITTAFLSDIDIESVSLEQRILYVDVDASYLSLRNVQQVICRSAMTWTVTSLSEIDGMVLSVEGCAIRTQYGTELGIMNRDNVRIDESISAETTEYAILKLYFGNETGTNFVIEDRVVEVNANQPREKTILEQLIAGPQEQGAYATLSSDIEIREVTTTDDGICYVNLSQNFLSKPAANTNFKQNFVAYSIVNSLCELENVQRVQFLVEGEKIDAVKSDVDFSKPLYPEYDMSKILTS